MSLSKVLIQDRQSRFGGSKSFRFIESSIGILGNLLAGFKVPIVSVVVFVLAILGRIVSADLGPRLVDATTIVVLQVFAFCVNQNEPRVAFGEHAGKIMQQIPSQIVKICRSSGLVDRQGKISAAFSRTVGTEDFVGFKFTSLDLSELVHRR